MRKLDLKYKISLILIIVVLILIIISMVLFVRSRSSLPSGKVSFQSSSNTIIIKNILSVTDEFGKNIEEDNGGAFGYLEFSVLNDGDKSTNYQVYITLQDTPISLINGNYINFYLTNFDNVPFADYSKNIIPSYVSLSYIDDMADSKLLYKGRLNAGESQDFKLRVWLSDGYVISLDEEVFPFSISARAV